MRQVRKADNLTTSLGTLTSWKPLGHSRPVAGLIYLFISNQATIASFQIHSESLFPGNPAIQRQGVQATGSVIKNTDN